MTMKDNEYVLLDTRVFDTAAEKKNQFLSTYNKINRDYEAIVIELLQNWKGRGADAFARDAGTVRANLTGIYDILKTMCDALTDCREIFDECDTALAEFNRNPEVETE